MAKYGRRRSRGDDDDRQMSQYENEERYEEVIDEYEDEEGMIELDPVEVDRLMTRLESEQSLPGAVIGGLVGALVGAGIWGGIVYAFKIKSGLIAILVGIIVGMSVRIFGKGLERIYGVLGAVFALAACAIGLVAAAYALFMQSKGLSVTELIPYIKPAPIIAILKRSFSGFDLVFYAIAAYEGYQLSFRNIEVELEELVMRQQGRHR